MLVSALVLTTDPGFIAPDVAQLERDARVSVGVRDGAFLPVVTVTRDLDEARELAKHLQQRPRVIDVQLVSWMEEEALVDDYESSAVEAGHVPMSAEYESHTREEH